MKIYKYILEITVFVCGAVVMVYELVGSRVLGPYFGTSIFVWTSLIGIILGSLSLGYYLGGKIADKRTSFEQLSLIIFIAAIFILATTLMKDLCLVVLQNTFSGTRLSSVLASFILFFPASFLLGMISPYTVKLKMRSLDTSASTVGNLYAISTLGSIFGTFLAGFYLIPFFGTNKLLMILSLTLIIISILLNLKRLTGAKIVALVAILICWVMLGSFHFGSFKKEFIDVDTAYNRIWIYDRKDINSEEFVRVMGINNENHSSMFLQGDELVNEYTKYYHLAKHFNPDFRTTLMLGGAGYSYPKSFLTEYPKATIDVVEIDPKVTELAKKYFRLKPNSRLSIYHEDGRVYLNRTDKKYDVIFGDAFSSRYSLPYQLTTKEAVQKKFEILNNGGVVVLNIISAIEGDRGKFLRAEYLTYKEFFPQVFLFPVKDSNNGSDVQNIILVALKSDKEQSFTDANPELNGYLAHLWTGEIASDVPILTDDFAPVDHYITQAI